MRAVINTEEAAVMMSVTKLMPSSIVLDISSMKSRHERIMLFFSIKEAPNYASTGPMPNF